MQKGSKRNLNRTGTCGFCNKKFACADPKAARCEVCRKCPDCGILTRSRSRYCRKCQKKHPTERQVQQLRVLHASMFGQNNPSKRPEVRKLLSVTKMGDLNPARIYREQYAAHIRRYRPGKISKLEISVGQSIPELKAQYKIGPFTVDFAEPDKLMAVEVQGCWFHCCIMCFPDSPKYPTQHRCLKNDQNKRRFLQENGWSLIELIEHEIRGKSNIEIRSIYEAKINNRDQIPV